jgi:hypothetical protein
MNGLHIAKCISFLCWLFISCTLKNLLIALISHMVVGRLWMQSSVLRIVVNTTVFLILLLFYKIYANAITPQPKLPLH